MFREDGSISFATELAQVVDTFLAEYQKRQGPLKNDLERGLVISYVLGVMQCELQMLWDTLAEAPIFGGLHPRVVFEDCLGKGEAARAAQRQIIAEILRRQGWLANPPNPKQV